MARKSRPLKDYEKAYRARIEGLPGASAKTLLYLLVNSESGSRVHERAGKRKRSEEDWQALLEWARANADRAGIDAGDAQAVEEWAETLLTVSASARGIAEAFGKTSSNTGAKRLDPIRGAGILRQVSGASGRRAPLWVFEPLEFSAAERDGRERNKGVENGGKTDGDTLPDWY